MENALFVRTTEFIQKKCEQVHQQLLDTVHNPDLGVGPFLGNLLDMTLKADQKHDDTTDYGFYNRLWNALQSTLQDPTEENMTISYLMAYAHRVEFAGVAPMIQHRPALMLGTLGDVEPVFNVWCQDDEQCPLSTLSFRFSVDATGNIHTIIINSDWLTIESDDADEESVMAIPDKQAKAPKKSVHPDKKVKTIHQ